ncbi:MAG: S8 family serine peptidase, partial [Bacilli bacterium]|nr:S8 family serine peptidase [Bacilli bacterium]
MKKIICFIEIIFLISFLYAQTGSVESSNYYYLKGNPCFWGTDSTSIIFLVDTNQISYAYSRLQMMFSQEDDTVMYSEDDDNIIVISSSLPNINVDSVILFFSTNYGIDIYFWSYAKKISGKRLWLRNEVLSKVKSAELFPQIIDIINRFNHSTVTIEDSVYLNVCCADDATVIHLANALFESGLVVFSQPDFYYSYENHYNDPLYNLQYYLHNNTNMGGMERFDLKTEYAWNFLRTVTPIDTPIVAIIDDGVEDHEDLMFNGRSKVLNGFPEGNHGRPKLIHVHGQCCAGIVGATQNNGKGISGVAPDSWIVPIRNQKVLWYNGIAYAESDFMNSGRIARGIRKSWKNYNSDILNNSWGSLDEMSDAITDAFICANSQGRNMKGCVVVASTGNDSSANTINFIGRIPNVISVGAINKNGTRCEYSNYSSEISVVAFGGDLDENLEADICTIDREGQLGNNDGNYHEKFGG